MLKKIALGGLMLSLFARPLLAQQPTTPASEAPAAAASAANKTNRMQHHQATDPATRARRQTDRMAKMLNLDQATAQKVYDADLARTQQVDAILKGTDANKNRQQALKANADAFKAKLQTILTPEQLAKVEQMKAQMKGRRHNRKGTPEDGGNDAN